MRVILDTSVFLWIIADDPRLSDNARSIFLDHDTEAHVSMASVWEMFIKIGTGKLVVTENPSTFLREQFSENLISLLPIHYEHCARVAELPDIHKDPFDRLIVAQALHTGLPVLSGDATFARYGVENLF
ncbi:MAG: PIN domain-containing protein [Spirochaetes bacterium]|jgi:PIN domain nuclease of toxin-antitoxin system|nr:PIN domain-containing protein [Spirochaetota bacterium]